VASRWSEHRGEWRGRIEETVLASLDGLLAGAGLGRHDVAGIGVAVAGVVASDRSTVVRAPIIRASGVALGDRLSERTGCRVTVHNDANAALFAVSSRDGDARRRQVSGQAVRVLLALGTGLGGAIAIDGRLLVGEHGFAAELGHVTVDPADGRTCACGGRGCAEQFASGRGLEELAAVAPPTPGSPAAHALAGRRASARDVVALAGEGDAWGTGLLTTAGTMLGRAIAILTVTLDPAVVTIAGSLGHAASRWILPAADAEMRRRLTYPPDRSLPRLELDPIGPLAAATGAALLATAAHEE
jgi:glucokinase